MLAPFIHTQRNVHHFTIVLLPLLDWVDESHAAEASLRLMRVCDTFGGEPAALSAESTLEKRLRPKSHNSVTPIPVRLKELIESVNNYSTAKLLSLLSPLEIKASEGPFENSTRSSSWREERTRLFVLDWILSEDFLKERLNLDKSLSAVFTHIIAM